MSFIIRPAKESDRSDLIKLATSLSAHGFLTLPENAEGVDELIRISCRSFSESEGDPDDSQYLFVLEAQGKAVGCSLVVARHGTIESPHYFFQVDPIKQTIQIQAETRGRTELGGLILDPSLRGHPAKVGKRLSWVRLLYILQHKNLFHEELIAELLPPFLPDGNSALWEALGRRFTGMSYREADLLSKKDKKFIREKFPRAPISIDSLPEQARAVLGRPGPESMRAARILEEGGFRYLNQIDPFDGGPHYGARVRDVKREVVETALFGDDSVDVRFSSVRL
jgi:arginine N-succinyltransferase